MSSDKVYLRVPSGRGVILVEAHDDYVIDWAKSAAHANRLPTPGEELDELIRAPRCVAHKLLQEQLKRIDAFVAALNMPT